MPEFKPFKIVTQTDHVEAGGMMDDCAWASLAGIANHVTGSSLDCGDGIAIGEKVGRHDRDGKGDGSSLAEMKKAAPLVGMRARYPVSWAEVEAALANPNSALAVSVQQPINYPDSVMPISKWHKNTWAPWAKVHDPKGYKAGYGHLTAAAGHAIGAQWACPTRSGKGVEALAIPVTISDFKAIASSHGDAPHKRVLIFTAAKGSATPNSPISATVSPANPPASTNTPPAAKAAVAAGKSAKQPIQARGGVVDLPRPTGQAGERGVQLPTRSTTAKPAAQVIDTAAALRVAAGIVGKLNAAKGNSIMGEQIKAAALDALQAAISTAIAVFLGLGISIFDLTGEGAKAIVASAVGAGLMVLQRWLDKDNTAYGRGN
jgi:hypothetical protein